MKGGIASSLRAAVGNKPLFDKILIANRGEIACRIIRTTKRLGIRSVSIFSEADMDALHVKAADEAFFIGRAPSTDSYLSIDKVLQAVKESKAQAVHPGYGFLSENYKFAEELAKIGATFIGPPIQALKDMGSKSASKEIMTAAGVPVVPGYHGEDQDPSCLKTEAGKIGYPLMIKAVMGGGGKGMRIVENECQFDEMLESAKREALKSFNDDKVLLEKYVKRSRHIEVQVFGDTQGNAVYLFERDCSVQRRHQKVLEEAPAAGLSEDQRRRLGEMAVAAAKAVSYVGAGTVEFIYDCDTHEFYFMEMNTRLQVEHPVTEMITGLDLVDWQIQVASGNPLPLSQRQIAQSSHAIEARIYAENPENNFLPDTGTLELLRHPTTSLDLRFESGVKEGDEISIYYDPMIAKVIARGVDRKQALRRLDQALSEFHVVGVRTNIPFIRRILNTPKYLGDSVDTGFIAENRDCLFTSSPVPTELLALGGVALLALDKVTVSNGSWSKNGNTSSVLIHEKRFRLACGNQTLACSIAILANNTYQIRPEAGPTFQIKATVSEGRISALVNGRLYAETPTYLDKEGKLHLFFSDNTICVEFLPLQELVTRLGDVNSVISSPMSCKVSSVRVKQGQRVQKGDVLMIVEAMKMEHVIRAPRTAVIGKLYFKEGQIVGEKKTLVELVCDK